MLQVTEQPKTSSTMILALNNMKGFDTDVLAILQQTTTTSVNTVSTSYLEPEFAVGLLDDQEEKEEVTKHQKENQYAEEELSIEVRETPVIDNSELLGLLQGDLSPESKSGSSEVNCSKDLEDVREAKTMPDTGLVDNSTFADQEETDEPKLGGLVLSDTSTTSGFLQSQTSPLPSSLSPANKLQSEVLSRSSNQAVVIISAISVSLVLFALLVLLAYFLKKHRKRLLLWLSQWKMERSQSRQVR